MSDEFQITGSCLCKTVRYAIKKNVGTFQYCHCSRCRKFTGSAFAANLIISPDDFKWLKGQEHTKRYEIKEAKHFATSFCQHCGSSMPWLSQSAKALVVPAGTLDDDPHIRPKQNIFCDMQAVWYVNPKTLPQYDALPPKNASIAKK